MPKSAIASLAALILLVAGLVIFYRTERAPATVGNTQPAQQQNWETKTDDQATVTVVVAPLDVSAQSQEWRFSITMDTHSVELNQDLVNSSILIDDQGREYAPKRWEGPVGGHHREGVLIFGRIVPMPRSIELRISGIAGVVRAFSWQLTDTP